jgi:hypothetical protein
LSDKNIFYLSAEKPQKVNFPQRISAKNKLVQTTQWLGRIEQIHNIIKTGNISVEFSLGNF